jgi:hypothetical protein
MARFSQVIVWHLLLGCSYFAQAQTGTWNVLSFKTSLNQKWGAFAEGQIRSLKFYDDFHYHEFKGGVSYAFDKNFSFAVATGKYDTYLSGGDFVTPKSSDEVRLFEQMTMSQTLTRVKFEHRYRAEQRFTKFGYRNRFRYRFQMVIPINRNKVEPKSWFINTSGEIFFRDTPQYFERLRAFVGTGYQFTTTHTLMIGYMHQFDYRLVDEIGKNFLYVSFLFDLHNKKHSHKEKVPGNID